MQKKLCRKKYLLVRSSLLKVNISLLENILKHFRDLTEEGIIETLPPAYSNLPFSFFFDTTKLHPWTSQPFSQSATHPENKTIPTVTGEFVRSKSEQLIYNLLVLYNVPFHYEELIYVNKCWHAPDFTILLADGSRLYWEHVGMGTDKNYMLNHHKKMHDYEVGGISEVDNLILTFDKGKHGLSPEVVEGIIKGYILPYMDKHIA